MLETVDTVEEEKKQKAHRKRDQDALVPDTLIGRVVNLTDFGKKLFATAPINFCDALHYATAHSSVIRQTIKDFYHLPTRVAEIVIREANGMREGVLSNNTRCIGVTLDNIDKAQKKLEWRKSKGLRIGSVKNKIQQLNDKLKIQLRDEERASIFFGHDVYENQPVGNDPVSKAKFKKAYQEARYGLFGSLGSHEESYGNSTYQLRADKAVRDGIWHYVPIWHKCKRVGDLRLKDYFFDKLDAYQIQHEAVMVMFHYDKDHDRWMGHITLMKEGSKPYIPSDYFLGTDINENRMVWALVGIINGKLVEVEHNTVNFKGVFGNELYALLKKETEKLMALAKEYKATVGFDDLDLEAKKAKDHGRAMNRILHGMPYGKIIEVQKRCALLEGIPHEFVDPAFTSINGGAISAILTHLSRDHAAAAVSGLLSSDSGKKWLNALSERLLTQGGRYRTTVKGSQNLTLALRPAVKLAAELRVQQVTSGEQTESKLPVNGVERQSISPSRIDMKSFYSLGRELKKTVETMYAPLSQFRGRKRPRSNCPWTCHICMKHAVSATTWHELAAGSLNIENPVNFWQS